MTSRLATTLVVLATIAAVTLLLALGKPIPAGIASVFGTTLAGLLPGLRDAPPAPGASS